MKTKRAIVLSGGGAKGAYQVGVWKALRKLHITCDIVTGTSIGALNGIFFTQREFYKCIWMWKNINFSVIYSDSFPHDSKTLKGKNQIYFTYATKVLKEGGMDTSKIEALVRKSFKPYKFYYSPIDYGIITYNLSSMKPVIIQKKDFHNSDIVDYMIASATCFPAFQKKKIGSDNYIDGGYYDNLPINLAIDMGATEIIAVDLRAPGLKKQTKDKNVEVTYIKPRNKIVSFLIFDEKASKEAIAFGYNDTLKTYHKLEGNRYTFRLGELAQAHQLYNNLFCDRVTQIFSTKQTGLLESLLRISVYYKLFHGTRKQKFEEQNRLLEFLGETLKVDATKIYKISDYHANLLTKMNLLLKIDHKSVEQKIGEKDIKDLLHSQTIIKYMCDLLAQKNKTSYRYLITLATLFPHEFLGAVYLNIISE